MTVSDFLRRLLFLIVALFLICPPVEADAIRRWARREVRLMRKHNVVRHFRSNPTGARFVGVGTNGVTCTAGGRCSVHTKVRKPGGGTYDVRVWK